VRPLSTQFRPYAWAPSTAEIARLAGISSQEVLRFDGNTSPQPPPTARAETLAGALSHIHSYRHGGHPELLRAIADYAGVEPDNVVLGAGADDLIMLCARAYAGAGDVVAVADEPSYPLYRVAAWVAGADVGDHDPVLTFCCRPHNPTGALVDLPEARPLAVDEAYFEYAGETAVGLLDDDVIVIRTFSKAFGLASARVGYALAGRETAAELNERQAPAPISTLSAALALAGLADPPDVTPLLEERERLAAELRAIGLDPLPSAANFLYVPFEGADEAGERLLRRGIAVRPFAGALRITVRTRTDDDRLLGELRAVLAA
jgi:histidinol-phosphate aminotransferase